MSSTSTITPTIGRKVWFWSSNPSTFRNATQAIDATIIFVGEDGRVDLDCTDHHGQPFIAQDIVLNDPKEGGDSHGHDNYATWMPYQMGQAKVEGANKQAGASSAPVKL